MATALSSVGINSTHAPRTGSDLAMNSVGAGQLQFQPTLPARGATRRERQGGHADHISTHAPRTGSDCRTSGRSSRIVPFQPTLPARGATFGDEATAKAAQEFQPTLPARGATIIAVPLRRRFTNFNPRSPHGSDQSRQPEPPAASNFNPRSPHGERRRAASRRQSRQQFQPTLPARGATAVKPLPL